MFDIIAAANALFGGVFSSCSEILREFSCEYSIERTQLPDGNKLEAFIHQKPDRDKILITITSDNYYESVFVSDDNDWKEDYNSFIKNLFDDDKVFITIKINKRVDNGCLSVYSLNRFSEFLSNLRVNDHLINFTELFRDCGEHIVFQLMDSDGSLRTNSILFSSTIDYIQWNEHRDRREVLEDCQDAGVFLDKIIIGLMPQDFYVIAEDGNGFKPIVSLFSKLRSVLSFIYLANTASVVGTKAILQFDPSTKGYEYELNQLTESIVMPLIFDWVFNDVSCVDKATIARKIINIYCRDRDSILTIDETVLNSIKSNYLIYQKNHADQYIDMKKSISEFIVESIRKIQEISHDITDAFRNNFVAVIVFLMTVILTDSIDFSRFFEKEISQRIVAVCCLFTVVTILYCIVTFYMGKQKWKWLKQSYEDLKKNYDGVFDCNDIEEAFNHDEPIIDAEKQYTRIRNTIGCIWIILILAMTIFSITLIWHGNSKLSLTQTKVEVTLDGEGEAIQQ